MNIEILELKEEHIAPYKVENFLFKMIKENYNLDYVPSYHYDIKNLYKYYIEPPENNFYIVIDKESNKLIGTSGIRSYDKNYNLNNRKYNKNDTATLYRLFVEKDYRHNKIATQMINIIENFCKNKGYKEIYLHTQKNSYGALPFWLKQNYNIIYDTLNNLGTIHMEKIL